MYVHIYIYIYIYCLLLFYVLGTSKVNIHTYLNIVVYIHVYICMCVCVGCWLLDFYVLTTSNVISGQVPTCDSAHSLCLYSATSLGDQTTSTITLISHSVTLFGHIANQSLPYPNNAQRLTSKPTINKCLSHWFASTRVRTRKVRILRSPKMADGR